MKGIKPEPDTGESVIIGRRHCPVQQVGQVITRQDGCDVSAAEVVRAVTRLGFTCRPLRAAAPVGILEVRFSKPPRCSAPGIGPAEGTGVIRQDGPVAFSGMFMPA